MRVLEIAGLGPGPFCGMLLADLGADVVVVARVEPNPQLAALGDAEILNRGKRLITLDLKTTEGIQTVLALIERCEALVEGMRPGVMERLGLGPDICLARNPRLAYGRVTGWGQSGPLAQAAGHDLNYIALSGALWYSGQPGQPPLAPPTLVGDVGGGALYLAVGLLAAVMQARITGRGQVVDAAIVDGTAHMMNLLLSLGAAGQCVNERGQSILDGPHWYATYRCADGQYLSVGALEPKFYRQLLERLDLDSDPQFDAPYDTTRWRALRDRFGEIFATRTRAEWCALLEGSDACFAPVLNPEEAASHPHMEARAIYSRSGASLQAAPAPRFSGTSAPAPRPVSRVGADTVLDDWAAAADLR